MSYTQSTWGLHIEKTGHQRRISWLQGWFLLTDDNKLITIFKGWFVWKKIRMETEFFFSISPTFAFFVSLLRLSIDNILVSFSGFDDVFVDVCF